MCTQAAGTAANVHDVAVTSELIREDDEAGCGDSGYLGVEKREEIKNNENFKDIEFKTSRPALRSDVQRTESRGAASSGLAELWCCLQSRFPARMSVA